MIADTEHCLVCAILDSTTQFLGESKFKMPFCAFHHTCQSALESSDERL